MVMKKTIAFSVLTLILTSCWPTAFFSLQDKGMPKEWKEFYVNPIEVTSATAPSSYGAVLSESIRSGVQNNTRLKLVPNAENDSTLQITAVVTNYSTSPVAIQEGDNATENRLSVTVNVVISSPTKGLETLTMSSTRFANYNANQQLVDVEQALLENINQQIVQDVINKLNSNW